MTPETMKFAAFICRFRGSYSPLTGFWTTEALKFPSTTNDVFWEMFVTGHGSSP